MIFKRIKLLQEDDCAPDAREYFEKEMVKKFNLSMNDFMKKGEKHIYSTGIERIYQNYVLSFFAEDPFYLLEQIVEDVSHG